MDIAGKAFIVTGGASGLGEGTARMLAREGAHVVIADLQAERGEAVAQAIGGRFVRCDVTQADDAQRAVDAAVALGRLGGLVNCAGIAPAARTVGKDGPHALELFSKVVSINLIGSFNMIRVAGTAMARNEPEATGERGVLISTASIAAYDGQIGQAAYAASNGGVVGMTLPIARVVRHAPRGARCPGRQRALPVALGHAGGLCQAGARHRHQRDAQRRGHSLGWCHPPRAQVIRAPRQPPMKNGPIGAVFCWEGEFISPSPIHFLA
jgi:NAD(P)-dependent dehydrogenase (short-subunit alcohol dehydrogenase family)